MAPRDLPIQPHIGSSFEWQPIDLRIEFGDGYSERVGDGPQTFRDTWTLVFKNLTPEKARELGQFVREHGARTAFYWAPPWDAGTSANPAIDPNNMTKFKQKLWTFMPGSVRYDPQVSEGAETSSLTGQRNREGLITLSVQIRQEFDIV